MMKQQVYATLLPTVFAALLCCRQQVNATNIWRRLSHHNAAPQQQPQEQRQLQLYDSLAGYKPTSLVIDQASIDLDVKALEDEIGTKIFKNAMPVYQQGGHSDSYAVLQIIPSKPVSMLLEQGQQIMGTAKDGTQIMGEIRQSITTQAGSFAGKGRMSKLYVNYDVSTEREAGIACNVGGLGQTVGAVTSGCFNTTGSLTSTAQSIPFATFSYTVSTGNMNGRTLQDFSTNAEATMWNCSTCPYDDFRKYVKFYGKPTYGDEFIMSAFSGTPTRFINGNADFSLSYTRGGRGEAITNGALLLNVWMMVVGEMEAALDQCVDYATCPTCIYESMDHWDTAVAYYTGSQQGADGSGLGYLLYQRANDLCQNFRTCGNSGSDATGVANVNVQAIQQFQRGQQAISQRKCQDARNAKESIVKLMTVPLIQGTLLNAYIQEQQADYYDVERAEVQGAAYAAAVLPIIYNCSQDDADVVYSYMGVGHVQNVSYTQVKMAFEKNYACMGISCGQVGGYWLQVGEYGVNAAPCSDDGLSEKKKLGIGLGTPAAFLFILVCFALYLRYGRTKRQGKEVDTFSGNHLELPVEMQDTPLPPVIT